MSGQDHHLLPYANSAIAIYLARQIELMAPYKSQREVAAEAGYEKPNMLSMMKRGESRVPLERVPALAKALNVDPGHLFRLAMETYWPEIRGAVHRIFRTVVSANELQLLDWWRNLTGNSDVAPTVEALEALVEKLRSEARSKSSSTGEAV